MGTAPKKLFTFLFFFFSLYAQRKEVFHKTLEFPFPVKSGSAVYYNNGRWLFFLRRSSLRVTIVMHSSEGTSYKDIQGKKVKEIYSLYATPRVVSFHSLRNKGVLIALENIGLFDFKTGDVSLHSTRDYGYISWSVYHRVPFLRTGEVVILFWEGDYKHIKTGKDIAGKYGIGIVNDSGKITSRFGKYPMPSYEKYLWSVSYFSYAVDTFRQNDIVCVQYGGEGRLYLYEAPDWEEKQKKILMPPGYFFVGTDKENYYFTGSGWLFAYDKETLKRKNQWSLEPLKPYKGKKSSWYSNGFHFTGEKRYIQYYRYDFYDKNKVKIEVHTIYFE